MARTPIDKPKVFISYAWESGEYKDRVRSFATELRNAGIDVILDQWELREGNDMNAFMEASVVDESVTSVLILLSPKYEEKANARAGGVGTETQIISPEVYGRVSQTKFLPVVFMRSPDGSIPKPAYLKSLLHFDLSDTDSYSQEYRRLVQALYGVEILPKPELGTKPAWVDEVDVPSPRVLLALDRLKGNEPPQIKHAALESELATALDTITRWNKTPADYNCQFKYLNMYLDVLPLRNDFNRIAKCYPYVENGHTLVADALERLSHNLREAQGDWHNTELKKTLVHELFLYFVAIMQGYGDARALGDVLSREYQFDRHSKRYLGFGMFYHHDDELSSEVGYRDGQSYISPMAKFWLENIDPDTCTGEAFVLADELCFNAAILSGREGVGDTWFPKTYIYDGNYAVMRRFANGLRSESRLEKAAVIFGFKDPESFVDRFREVEVLDKTGEYKEYRYRNAYGSAPLLCHFVASEQLGEKA